MKFWNKETGKIYDISKEGFLGSGFCGKYSSCNNCPISEIEKDLSVDSPCFDWVENNPNKAAEIMGYELIEEPEEQKETIVSSLKDTGNRTPMGDTGFVRDCKNGVGRMDLLPWNAIIELSKHCQEGAIHYGERNIDKGAPLHSLLDSGARHLAKFMAGYTDEDHLRAALWNIAWALEQKTTHPELNDTPWEYFKKDKE